MPPIPTYVYVAPEIASGLTKLPAVTETPGANAVPNATEGSDAVTVMGLAPIVIV